MTVTIGNSLRFGLLILALICFVIATLGIFSHPRVSWVALGLALLTAALLVSG